MGQREDLLAGAKKCLVEKGYHRTTARDIAAASGAHLASIGYHYGSKDALMNRATLEAQGEWGHAMDAAILAAGTATPTRRLQICVDELIAAMTRQREVLVASVQTYAQAEFDDDIRQALIDGTRGARIGLAAAILGVDPADVDDAAIRGMGSVVHSLIAGLTLQALLDPESLPTGEQVGQAMSALVKGKTG
jgi:AcrR family transcriptional regulator